MSAPGHTLTGMSMTGTPTRTHTLTIPSPVGPITLRAHDTALTAVEIGTALDATEGQHTRTPHPILSMAAAQLDEYFAGVRTEFDLPLELAGTDFQLAVWEALETIPYGQTRSYADIADLIGKHGAARAVGGAVGANPIPIIIPCHRVMGANGAITGYSGGDGISTKKALLERESR